MLAIRRFDLLVKLLNTANRVQRQLQVPHLLIARRLECTKTTREFSSQVAELAAM